MLRNPVIGAIVVILLLVAINLLYLDIIIFSQGKNVQNIVTYREVPPTISPTPTPLPTPFTTPVSVISLPQASAKEYYIPLGSGTTRSSDYVSLEGAEAHIDTSLYGNIKQVTFEVFLRNPTGNGVTYAKLFNVTDKHDVWFSEVSMVGGGTSRKDAAVTLEPGNKLYRVYLKSTLAFDVYADNARIHIVTQ